MRALMTQVNYMRHAGICIAILQPGAKLAGLGLAGRHYLPRMQPPASSMPAHQPPCLLTMHDDYGGHCGVHMCRQSGAKLAGLLVAGQRRCAAHAAVGGAFCACKAGRVTAMACHACSPQEPRPLPTGPTAAGVVGQRACSSAQAAAVTNRMCGRTTNQGKTVLGGHKLQLNTHRSIARARAMCVWRDHLSCVSLAFRPWTPRHISNAQLHRPWQLPANCVRAVCLPARRLPVLRCERRTSTMPDHTKASEAVLQKEVLVLLICKCLACKYLCLLCCSALGSSTALRAAFMLHA